MRVFLRVSPSRPPILLHSIVTWIYVNKAICIRFQYCSRKSHLSARGSAAHPVSVVCSRPWCLAPFVTAVHVLLRLLELLLQVGEMEVGRSFTHAGEVWRIRIRDWSNIVLCISISYPVRCLQMLIDYYILSYIQAKKFKWISKKKSEHGSYQNPWAQINKTLL